MERLVCLAIGYVFGIFQTAYIYGKMHGIDIRQCGSGNAGATNTLRVLGKKAGLIVFLGDVAKTVLAVLAVRLIFGSKYPDMLPLLGCMQPQARSWVIIFRFSLVFAVEKESHVQPVWW